MTGSNYYVLRIVKSTYCKINFLQKNFTND